MNADPAKKLSEPISTTPKFDLERYLGCPGCDLLLERITPGPGEKLCCPRCGETLLASKPDTVNHTLAFALSGLLLYPYAIFEPILTLDSMGLKNSGNIFACITDTWHSGYQFVAVIVGLTAVFFPLLKLLLLFYISLRLKQQRTTPHLTWMLRLYIHLDEWGMLEVFMIGLLVTIIKIHHMAHIDYNVGFFCFVGLLVTALGSSMMMDKEEFWRKLADGQR